MSRRLERSCYSPCSPLEGLAASGCDQAHERSDHSVRRLARNHFVGCGVEFVGCGVEEVVGANLVPLVVVQHPLGF